MTLRQATLETPTGRICLTEADGAITRLCWDARAEGGDKSELIAAAKAQLGEYFDGQRQSFDLPLAPRGDAFQQRFLGILRAIPYGETRTYGEIAREMGVSAQAIGQACGANPIPILIPCHRVLAADGLGGFSGGAGVETKVALLKLEGAAGLLI
jgi:methylated-DNA-[protein]-cysteine S-methyltransferase